MYYKLKNPKAKEIFAEIIGRMDFVEVKGESVEQLYMIRMGIKQLIQSMEVVNDDPVPKEVK